MDERLNRRVDKMLEEGLMQELKEFHSQYNLERSLTNQYASLFASSAAYIIMKMNFRSRNYTLGIFQSIGFKEFHSYLILPEEERDSKTGNKMFQESVNQLKMVTRRYARKQNKWVKNRFLSETGRQVSYLHSFPDVMYKPNIYL